MSPRTKGSTAEEKKIWYYYFNFNLKKSKEKDIDSLNKKMQDELLKYGFRNYKEYEGIYDLKATLSLELEYNASKFANDLLKKYKYISEIEVRER